MLLAAVSVDPINDWLDYTNAGLAAVGGLAGLVAIVIALRAQRAADRTVAEERQRMFEVDVLRELMTKISEPGQVEYHFSFPSSLRRYDFQLSLLSTRLEFWELARNLDAPADVVDAVGLGTEYRAVIETINRLMDEQIANSGALEEAKGVMLYRATTFGRDLEAEEVVATAERKGIELHLAEEAAHVEQTRLRRVARARLGEKLAYDLQQAVLSRVGAGRQDKLPLWRRLWWYRV